MEVTGQNGFQFDKAGQKCSRLSVESPPTPHTHPAPPLPVKTVVLCLIEQNVNEM